MMRVCCGSLRLKISYWWYKFVREKSSSIELRESGKKMESKRDLVIDCRLK